MKRISLSALLIGAITVTGLHAQNNVDRFFMSQQLNTTNNMMASYNANAGIIEGTPFYNTTWRKGTIKATDGNIYSGIDLKFESYNSLLMVKYKQDSLIVFPQVITEFSFDDAGTPIVFKNGHYDEKLKIERTRYLQVINEGYWSAYKDVSKELKEANFDPVFQTGSRVDQFVEKDRYLLVNPQGEWTSMTNPRRRSMERFFGDKSREVREFVRQNNLEYDNEAHLARIFEYVNSLD
jgi:hypothetical protein